MSLIDKLKELVPDRGNRVGQPPAFAPEEIEAIYDARRRGVSWTKINTILDEKAQYKRPGSLAAAVHQSARRHTIEPYITASTKVKTPKAHTLV